MVSFGLMVLFLFGLLVFFLVIWFSIYLVLWFWSNGPAHFLILLPLHASCGGGNRSDRGRSHVSSDSERGRQVKIWSSLLLLL